MRVIESCFLILAVAALYSTVESLRCRARSTPRLQNTRHQHYASTVFPFSSNKVIPALDDNSLRSTLDYVKKSSTALFMSEFGEVIVESSRPSVTQNLYRPLKTMGKRTLNGLMVVTLTVVKNLRICTMTCSVTCFQSESIVLSAHKSLTLELF